MYDRKIGASMRERKNLACTLEIKSLDAEGRFAGYASVFNVLDNQKDIILRGAFADTIRGRVSQIKLLWQHQPDEPIGVFNAMFEDSRGLYVEGRLLLSVERAREAFALLKSGAVTGLSIGYSPVHYRIDPDTGIRKLSEVDLWEVSLVTFPANEQANVTVVKSRPQRRQTKGELVELKMAAEHGMEELWSKRDDYFALPDYFPAGGEAISIECKSIRAGCDWIKTYSTLLQVKAHADALLKYSPDQPRDDHGRWTDEGGDASESDSQNDTSYHGDADLPVEPVYPVENAAALLATGGLSAVGEGAAAEGAAAAADTEWALGGFKSGQTWTNQMESREWTPEQITDTIEKGDQFPAPNNVNPTNTATRYQDSSTGRYVVRDDNTKEILQISGKGDFKPLEMPTTKSF